MDSKEEAQKDIGLQTKDYWYDLPEELIAQTPLQKRDTSRLMVLDRQTGEISHRHFYDVLDYLNPGDCLVMNDSRVLPARLLGHRPTGGAVEVLLLRDLGNGCWECLCKPGKKMQPGSTVSFGNGELTATVKEVRNDGNRVVEFHYEGIFLEVLERLGKMPLPPYIKAELADQERYQTVYSREVGSAAAPTAGLHFTKELLEKIREKGVNEAFVTLHVGLGTFRPVKADNILEHHMHSELCMMNEETADYLRGHHFLPYPGISGAAGQFLPGVLQMDGYFHLSGVQIQGHGRAHYQFPSAGKYPGYAGFRFRRTGACAERLQSCGSGKVPLFQLRRRHVPCGRHRKP